MLVKDREECKEIKAKDQTELREILHPKNDAVDLRFSVAYARVRPGKKSEPHRLRSTEVYYILKGKGMMNINQESREVREGSAVHIPPNSVQHIENTGEEDLEFLCIVEPPWLAEDDEVV
jgi:mannose-6-phosphate isomerase-like protein (cupin superfamily)